jgi:hypothetical protein
MASHTAERARGIAASQTEGESLTDVQQPRRPAAQTSSSPKDQWSSLRLVRIILQEILLLALTLLIPLAFRDICIRFVLRIRRREYDHFGRTESCAGLWLGRDTIASVILIVIAIRDDGGGGG